jgi:hypothetical protein
VGGLAAFAHYFGTKALGEFVLAVALGYYIHSYVELT